MASPGRARGKKSRANLRRGGPGGHRPDEKEIKRISRTLLRDPAYCKNLRQRLREGKLQPGVEVMLWYYAFGKPAETIETKQVAPVRVVHEYTAPPVVVPKKEEDKE